MRCQLSLVDKFLKEVFYRFGKFIGEQPGYFLIVPLLITALCASGFQRIQHVADPEYLFSPVQGEAKSEMKTETLEEDEKMPSTPLKRKSELVSSGKKKTMPRSGHHDA